VMMEAIFDRMPDYTVIETEAELYPTISPINGWINMPIAFPPGSRLNATDPEWLCATSRG
jgi:hypothetical protein